MQTAKRTGSVLLIASLLAVTGAAGVSSASPTSPACKKAKAALKYAKKHHAAPGKIKRLQARVRSACR
jgi:hypothetical protein